VEYRASGISKHAQVAVQSLDIAVNPCEVFGFIGPNGAGKTSTMKVLLGFQPASAGEARLFGVDVRRPIARQRIGYLPEQTYYYKFLTAEEILRFYARLFGIPRDQRERRIDEILTLVDLKDARRRPIRTYSKGMQQRIGIAQALVNDPDLLILDEPTSGLDPVGRMQVRSIIQHLRECGKTVFFSSHELGEVETICDRVGILCHGELKAVGTARELLGESESSLEQAFLRIIGHKERSAQP
jgi:ABC-2 type transport system ATP-binding protein